MQAIWRGQVIAESERTEEVGGYRYFPREDVRMDLLRPAPKTASDLECPHGVRFYDVVADGRTGERAAWSYEGEGGPAERVGHWLGFWEDVRVE